MYAPVKTAVPRSTRVTVPSSVEFELPNYQTRHWYPGIRDVLEVITTGILLIPASVVIAVAGLIVKLTSRGDIFYRQTRVGLNGQDFTIYKIRSMQQDCERKSGAIWSTKGDARITPVGRVLRRLHIDELPQLWNVIRRDMSLIGPRPERPVIVEKLEKKVPRYRERILVRPGVTGLAQVQLPPDSDEADVWQKQAYDLYYIANMSPWLDFRILLATALKLICIPYSLLSVLLGMPREEEIYHYYLDGSEEIRETPEPGVAHVQTA